MAAPTHYYVDPVGGSDTTGTGAIGAPWKTVQKALDSITRDAVNGDQINVKAGGDDVLGGAAPLSLASYGTPDSAAPLVIRGYSAAANDGGMGGIDANGWMLLTGAPNSVHFIDMHLHNSTQTLLDLGNDIVLARCRIGAVSSVGGGEWAVKVAARLLMWDCEVYDCEVGVAAGNGAIAFSAFRNVSKAAIQHTALQPLTVLGCSLQLVGAANGIEYRRSVILHNTIYAAGGTGVGVGPYEADVFPLGIIGNYVEGLSGVGGVGIQVSADDVLGAWADNQVVNCATEWDLAGGVYADLGGNVTPGASGLRDPVNEDYAATAALRGQGRPTTLRGTNTPMRLNIGASQDLYAALRGVLTGGRM